MDDLEFRKEVLDPIIMKGRPSPHKGKPWSEKRRNAYLKSVENKNALKK